MDQKKIANLMVALAIAVPILLILLIGRSLLKFDGNFSNNPFAGKMNSVGLNKAGTGNQADLSKYKFADVKGDMYLGNLKDYNFYDNFLRSSTKKLDAEMYSITDSDVKRAVRELAQDGVKERIITEDDKYMQSGADFDTLQSQLDLSGIQLKSDKGLKIKYLHSKFVIVDDQKFAIQTANWTYSSFFKNNEAFFFSSDSEVLRSLKYIFDSDRNGSTLSEYSISPNLLVCPLNCRTKVQDILNSAEKSIYIQTQDIEDKSVLNILKSKSNIDMKIVLSDAKSSSKVVSLLGADKVKIVSKPYIHIKSILVDDKYLIIGSINMTSNSMDNNREVSIVLINPDLISKYKDFFAKYVK